MAQWIDARNEKIWKWPSFRHIEEWGFKAVWILGKFKRFICKILLASKTCSPVTFSQTNLPIKSNKISSLKLGHFATFSTLFSVLVSILVILYQDNFFMIDKGTWPRHAKSLLASISKNWQVCVFFQFFKSLEKCAFDQEMDQNDRDSLKFMHKKGSSVTDFSLQLWAVGHKQELLT